MKPLVQILPLPQNSSFFAGEVEDDWFETGIHLHAENELILFTNGSGQAQISSEVIYFEQGDIFLLGSNLSHTFKKDSGHSTKAIVIQFREECFGMHFMDLPECQPVKQLLDMAAYGLKITGSSLQELQSLIQSLITARDVERIIILLKCLQCMISAPECIKSLTSNVHYLRPSGRDFINTVSRFTRDHFQDNISLWQVASAACMSVPSFCHYFKEYTKQTYIDYLNQVRVEYACQQLLKTNKSVAHICFESGYNTIAHFHRQFLKIKSITPLQHRKTRKITEHTIVYKLTAQAI